MFLRILARIEKLGVYLSAFFILTMMVLTSLDTFFRDAFDHPLSGVYELHSMLIAAVLFLGLSYVQAKRNHIRMDVLSSKLSPLNQLFLQILEDVIFLSIAALIAWRMGLEAWRAYATGDFMFGVVRFPLWPVKLAITLGTGLVSLRLITDIIRNPVWRSGLEVSRLRYYMTVFLVIVFFAVISAGLVLIKDLNLSGPTIGLISMGTFLLLLFIGVPVAASMALMGILGIWMLVGVDSALGIASTVPFSSASEYILTVIPLFIVMGTFAGQAGFAKNGFDLARRWLENIKGGIVYATVVGSTIFAAATGSSGASCAVLTKLTLPEMLRNGIKRGMAIGVIASASTLAIMIPPSTAFVIYAMLTGNSIGKLLIAGIVPGLIGATLIMLTVYIRCLIDPSQIKTISVSHATWKERFSAIPGVWGIALIVLVVIGGIFSGFFTPTEAGAVGAFVTLIAVISLRKGTKGQITQLLAESAGITSMVLFILVGGVMFGNMLSLTRLPAMLSQWIVDLGLPPMGIIVCIMFIYFILGCFLDSLSTMIVTLPIMYPVIINLGFDPIWFGVLMVQNAEIAVVTPPYGMNLFLLKALLPDFTMGEIFQGSLWFILPMVVTMAIYVAFPQVALWLPNMMTK